MNQVLCLAGDVVNRGVGRGLGWSEEIALVGCGEMTVEFSSIVMERSRVFSGLR